VIAASTEPRNGNSNLTKNRDRHHCPNGQHSSSLLLQQPVVNLWPQRLKALSQRSSYGTPEGMP
jgi:hypothetical protein